MSLADAPSPNAIIAGTAAAYAGEDARRSAWLTLVVKQGGTCQTCGAGVADAYLSKHPGACSTCMKRGRGRPIIFAACAVETSAPPPARLVPVNPEEPAAPAEAETMPRGKREKPWPCCGSQSHRHLKTCTEAGKTRPIVVPVTRRPGVALLGAPGPAAAPRGGPTKAAPAELPGSIQAQIGSGTTALLLAIRSAVAEELRRRLAAAENETRLLRAAVEATGEAAA